MKQRAFWSKRIVTTLVFLGLTACGGGGGGSGGTTTSTSPASWSGVKQIGASGTLTYGRGIAVDSGGNVYVTGHTEGNLDGNSTSGGRDWVTLKYSAVGARQYVKQMHATLGAGGAESDGVSVVTDASGNVYVAGYTYGDLDGNTRIGTVDMTLTKFDRSGAKLFTKQYGAAAAHTEVSAAVIDAANGFIYIVGRTNGSLDTATLTGTSDAFLAQYSTSGTLNYVRQLGVAGALTSAASVAVDSAGDVYLAGYTQGSLAPNTLTGSRDAFLARYSSSGTLSYVKQFGAGGVDTEALSVAVDGSGMVRLAGYTKGGLNGNTLTGTTDAFIAHYTAATGAIASVDQFGATGCGTRATDVTTDNAGNLYVAGETGCSLNGNTLNGTVDAFVAKYLNPSTLSYLRQFGATGTSTWPKAIAVDTSGNIFIAGSTEGSLPGGQLNGITDMFVAKYDNNGVLQ